MINKEQRDAGLGESLRQKAENIFRQQKDELLETMAPEELRHALYELQVHQIELELQAQELLRAQIEIEQSRDRYFELYDMAPVGYFTLTDKGIIVEANFKAAQLLRLERSYLIGKSLSQFIAASNQATYHSSLTHVRKSEQGQSLDLTVVRKDGTSFEGRLVCSVSSSRDEKLQFRIVVDDITLQVAAEKERLKTQKLEAVGILADGIAHDFNNLLTAIMGNISLAKTQPGIDDDVQRVLESAQSSARQAEGLAQQLLTFAKGGEPVRRSVRVLPLIRNAALFSTAGSLSHYELDTIDDLWLVDADLGQMHQALTNILLNATQAMPDGGKISICAENTQVEHSQIAGLGAGNYVKICISDKGSGIDPAHLPYIFDPYFTTKPEGSGLGLAVVFSIMKHHGGVVTVESDLGKGTTFHLYLPASQTPSAEPIEIHPATAEGNGRVLVMDDESIVRDIASLLLTRCGYQVETVNDGEAAIAAYTAARQSGESFDLVILDLTIRGGMGGRQAAERLLALDPTAKLVVSSGYSEDPVMADYRGFGFCAAVAKPYNIEELSQAVRRVLTTWQDPPATARTPTE
jgi:two-component system, cell cycle sensor histidine kinase and response regulator CckA